MRMLCTGNPNKPTVARSIKKIFPYADFVSTSTGWDLRLWDAERLKLFTDKIKHYDVFVNSSFICNGGQIQLLNLAYENYIKKMHVFNIGSTLEYTTRESKWGMVGIEKRALRDRSMMLNCKEDNFKSTHITPGGLNDEQPGHENWLDMDHIAETIDWILRRPFDVPHIGIE